MINRIKPVNMNDDNQKKGQYSPNSNNNFVETYDFLTTDYQKDIENVYEGATYSINPDTITKEMAQSAITSRLAAGRQLNRSVNMAIFDSIKEDLASYSSTKEMGR